MSTTDRSHPIKSVDVFSTGSAEQHQEHRFGSRLPKTIWALTSRSWVFAPINVFIVEHRDGLVLFDAGLNPAIVSNPNYIDSPVGRFFLRKVFRLHIGSEDTLSRNLETLGYSPDDVQKIVFSHLHFDHIGGIAEFPQAELIVSSREWDQLALPHPEREWILREHIELPGTKWRQIVFTPSYDPSLAHFDGAYDVLGDGSLTLLPTPGHTPGSLSMLVRSAGSPPLLLIGDLSYEVDLLMNDQLPGVYHDKLQLLSSFANVRALKKQLPDLVILASHDPAAADKINSVVQTYRNDGDRLNVTHANSRVNRTDTHAVQ